MFRVILGLLIFTKSWIQVSVDVSTLLDTAADCLRFVTEFFDIISKSGPHIYHSALQLTPQSSIVWKLYSQQIHSPVLKVVAGVPASWDSCTASAGAPAGVEHATWSPCGLFVAVVFEGTVQIQDSNTLERVSVLKPPAYPIHPFPKFLAFSPSGCLLACSYSQ